VIGTWIASPVGPVHVTVDGGVIGCANGLLGSWLKMRSRLNGSNPAAFYAFWTLIGVIAFSCAAPMISKKSTLLML
jgi:hypothetical protein